MNRKLVCLNHGNPFSNYCMVCMEPLCPACIQDHYKVHKDTGQFKIETLKNVQNICLSKVVKIKDLIEQENQKLDSDHSNFNVAVLFDRVMSIKKSMIAQINRLIQARLRDIQIMENQYRRTEIKKPCIEAAQLINTFLERLDNQHPNIIETFQTVLDFNDNEFIKLFYQQLNQNYIRIKNTKCQIVYEQIKYRNHLEDCFYIVNPYKTNRADRPDEQFQEQPQDAQESPFKKFAPSEVMSNSATPMSKKGNEVYDTKPIVIERIQDSFDLKDLKPPNELVIPITSVKKDSKKFLHYFQPESTNLHTISLESFRHKIVQISMPFPIPVYHKSLQLSASEVILTGGKMVNGRKNTKVFLYSFDRQKLREFCQVLPRSSHSVCKFKDDVYIFGGFSVSSIERSVEKITTSDIPKVYNLRPSRFGGFCTTTVFRDMIVKFSTEGIQVYHPTVDKWTYVSLKGYLYFQNCGAVEVNNNEIFVFGGYDDAERGVRNSFTLFVSNDAKSIEDYNSGMMKICRPNKFPLPKGQGFQDNMIDVKDGRLFVLQNVSDEFNECIDSQRQLLMFSNKGWQQVDQK